MNFKFFKEKQPLIHCITNPISITRCADLILALSCRPIMAEHPDEVEEITHSASSLLLNIGNITDARMKSIALSANVAQNCNIPFVFDAVGVACSNLRRKYTSDFLEIFTPSVIKGNYSEILALRNSSYHCSGVDSDLNIDLNEVTKSAAELAQCNSCIVLASGKADIVTDGNRIIYVHNGVPRLGNITGSGCMLGATIACFLSCTVSLENTAHACAFFGICGEYAEGTLGNGTFSTKLTDAFSILEHTAIEKRIKTEEIKYEKL